MSCSIVETLNRLMMLTGYIATSENAINKVREEATNDYENLKIIRDNIIVNIRR